MPESGGKTALQGGGDARGADAYGGGQWQLRLVISIPALLMLFILSYGLVSYQLFAANWNALDVGGAGEVARKLLRGHLYAMVGLSAAALAMGLGLAYAILRPVRAMGEIARLIAEGRLDRRAPNVAASRELGDLSRSFNSMIDFLNDIIHDRNRYLVEGIVTGILTLDLDGRVTGLNTRGAEILGEGAELFSGKTAEELRAAAPPRLRAFVDYLARAVASERGGEPEEVELRGAGGARSLFVAPSLLRDSGGNPFGLIVNFRDASEIRSLNAQLSKADQLAALGTFTMGLAHELRNPMSAIKGTIQLLRLEEEMPGPSAEYLDRVVREVDRLDGFIRELLDFSHQAPAPPGPADLNAVLRTALALGIDAAGEAGGKLEIVEDFDSLPPVIAEADRLAQAFGNMIRNALESARPGSRLTLSTRREKGSVAARISNTGSTISPEHRAKVFDPFFTTKEKGTGLGLAVAYQIVIQNGGELDLDAGEDEVEFTARFRLAEARAAEPAPSREAAAA